VPLIHLQGRLACTTPAERQLLLGSLAAHIRQSLRVPGCLFYDYAQSPDPLVWTLNACFASPEAEAAHRRMSAASDWGRATLAFLRVETREAVGPEIGPETEADERALYLLNSAIFGKPAEAQLVNDLRAEGALALSLVARFERAYLGHCAFSTLKAPFPAWALAPLAVRETVRRQGIGEALVRAGIAQARARGVGALFVLGDPAYYDRFGFSVSAARGYKSPYSGPQFQMLNLSGKPLPQGPVTYAPAFAKLSDEA